VANGLSRLTTLPAQLIGNFEPKELPLMFGFVPRFDRVPTDITIEVKAEAVRLALSTEQEKLATQINPHLRRDRLDDIRNKYIAGKLKE
jgi:hypothetical protein